VEIFVLISWHTKLNSCSSEALRFFVVLDAIMIVNTIPIIKIANEIQDLLKRIFVFIASFIYVGLHIINSNKYSSPSKPYNGNLHKNTNFFQIYAKNSYSVAFIAAQI
jgi:hypothetical protein